VRREDADAGTRTVQQIRAAKVQKPGDEASKRRLTQKKGREVGFEAEEWGSEVVIEGRRWADVRWRLRCQAGSSESSRAKPSSQ
jgi:hypothetical protein